MDSPLEHASRELQETEFQAAVRLQAAFQRLRNAMLIVDDQRRCVIANAPACGLLGINPQDVPWRRIDDFTPAEDRKLLEEQWEAFLANGAIEGWSRLSLPNGSLFPVEFSATANVLPGRHLSVVMPRAGRASAADPHSEVRVVRGRIVITRPQAGWMRIMARDAQQLPLTEREREVLGLVAWGLRGSDIAEQLVLPPETIKSHVRNAMTKLGAHTRAHAVAIALRTGQIDTLSVRQEEAELGLAPPRPRSASSISSDDAGMARPGESALL